MTPYPNIPFSQNSLKVFESVARNLSFTLAANELFVTQSAVSRQIKQLEDELNASLIERKHRSIELTDKGQELYTVLRKNFQNIESLVASWKSSKQEKIVINAALSYATRSLLPKIQKIIERYPEQEIVVIPSIEEDSSLYSGDYDLLIFNSRIRKQYTDDPNIFFMRDEYMAPVCASHLLNKSHGLESILEMPRLHPTLDHIDWKNWLYQAGYVDNKKSNSTTFYTLDLALSACLAGQGATVTDLLLILPELKRDFLVCPEYAEIHSSPWRYYCHQKSQSSIVKELADWLKQETERELLELSQLADKFGWKL